MLTVRQGHLGISYITAQVPFFLAVVCLFARSFQVRLLQLPRRTNSDVVGGYRVEVISRLQLAGGSDINGEDCSQATETQPHRRTLFLSTLPSWLSQH